MTRPIDDARQKLIAEGKKKLLADGYMTLSVKDLTAACDMATGTFYSYFKSKEKFVLAILEVDWDRTIAHLDELIASPLPFRQRIEGVFESLSAYEHDYWKVFLQLPNSDESNLRYRDSQLARMYDRVRQMIEVEIAQKENVHLPISPDKLANVIVHNLLLLAIHDSVTFDEFYDCLSFGVEQSEGCSYTDLLFQKILDTTQTMIFWKDADRRFLGVNKAFLEYYGFPSEDVLIGKTDEDMGWHTDPGPYRDDELDVLQGKSTYRVHGTCIARGEERDIVASKSPLYENGKIIGLVGSFDDVTTEYRQRDQIGHLTRTIESIPTGICIFRRAAGSSICVSVNSYLADMLGLSTEAFVGKTTEELCALVHPDDLEHNRDDEKTFAGQGAAEGSYRLLNAKTGNYLWLHWQCKVVQDDDGSMLRYYSFTDISDLKDAQTSEQNARRLFENSVEAAELFIYEYDIEKHTVTLMDNAFTRRRASELHIPHTIENVPECLVDLVAEKDIPAFLQMYDDVAAGKPKATCEISYRPSNSQPPLLLRLTYTTIYDSDGNPVKADGSSQNITNSRLSAEKYYQELAYIHADSGKNLIAKGHHDLTRNKVLEYIPSSGKALDIPDGYGYDQAYADFIKMPTHEDAQVKLADIFSRENLIERFQRGERSFSLDYRREKGRNTTTWVHSEVRTFQEPTSGDIECFIYTYDVTEKHLEQQVISKLMELGYDYISLIDRARQTIVYYGLGDLAGEVATTRGEGDYATTLSEKIDRNVLPEDAEKMRRACAIDTVCEVLAHNPSYSYAYNRRGPSGDIQRKLLRYCYLDEGQQTILMCKSDITRQYLQEQEQIETLREAKLETDRAAAAESMFLSSMSHDMRTPLNGILGFTGLALETDDAARKQDYLRKIDSSGHLMLDLVNDVLDLSKIASGRMELNPTVVDGKVLTDDVVTGIMQSAEAKHIELTVDTSKAEFCPIRVDRLRAQQVLLNLLSNAIKYTPDGGKVWLTLESHEPDAQGCSLRVTVADNGIGISEEFLPHLFEPFAQEHAPEARDVQGTGLGLSIVKRVIDLMGGSIVASSRKGEGTTFVVELPVERITSPEAAKGLENPISREPDVDLRGKRVLLIEDNYLNAEIAETLLKEKGIEVEHAVDGKAGLEAFVASAPGSFSAILMDLRMPVMDGIEATRAIRALDRPDATTIPIIAMTADAYDEDVRRCLDAGMDDHLSKPIDVSRLFHTLAKAIDGASDDGRPHR